MPLSGVTATKQDESWLKSLAVEQTIFQPSAGSIFAYYQTIWRIAVGIKYGQMTAFATTSGTLLSAAGIGVIRTSPTTTLDCAADLTGFTGTSYIDSDTCGECDPKTGGGDEEVLITHQAALVLIDFGAPTSVAHVWPDGLGADIIEENAAGDAASGYVLQNYTPQTELVYNIQTASFFKRIQHTISITRKFVRLRTYATIAGQFVDVLPTLYSNRSTVVTVDLGFLPSGQAMYINRHNVEITDTQTGEGVESIELIYLAPDAAA